MCQSMRILLQRKKCLIDRFGFLFADKNSRCHGALLSLIGMKLETNCARREENFHTRHASDATSNTRAGKTGYIERGPSHNPQCSLRATQITHTTSLFSRRLGVRSVYRYVSSEATKETAPLVTEVPGGKDQKMPIRDRLHLWQDLHGVPNTELLDGFQSHPLLKTQSDDSRIRLSTASQNRLLPSEEIQNWSANLDPSLDPNPYFLRPGDLVEISASKANVAEPHLAIFVRHVDAQMQFFLSNGKWAHRNMHNVSYSIPGFIDPRILEPLVRYLPTKQVSESMLDLMNDFDIAVPRTVSSPVIEKILAFHREVSSFYREHTLKLDSAYHLLSRKEETRFMTTKEIAEELLGTLAPDRLTVALYASRKALLRSGLGFNCNSENHRLTELWQVMPQNEVRSIESVQNWIREYLEFEAIKARAGEDKGRGDRHYLGHHIVNRFLGKVQVLIRQSRSKRKPTKYGCVGPYSPTRSLPENSTGMDHPESDEVIGLGKTFSIVQQEIIHFMEAWILKGYFNFSVELTSLASRLLAATGAYDEFILEKMTGYMFLQEIGVVAPFNNHRVFDDFLFDPRAYNTTTILPSKQPAERLTHQTAANIEVEPSANLEANTPALVNHTISEPIGDIFTDRMSGLRRDFKQLDVYCIDDKNAKEIDDGISIENIPGSTDYWVHVHIANPTAYIDKDHSLAQAAAIKGQTIYFPDQVHGMFPSAISRDHFSLADGRPTLTFSARLDTGGEVLERRVQNGVIGNVIRLSPGEVRQNLFSHRKAEYGLMYSVGDNTPRSSGCETKSPLSERTLSHLRKLQDFAKRRYSLRTGIEAAVYARPKNDILVGYDSNHHEQYQSLGASNHQVRRFNFDPFIQVKSPPFWNPFDPQYTGEPSLVEEAMLLCGEIAATWCESRKIPILYRGAIQDPSRQGFESFVTDIYRPSLDARGVPPYHIGLEYFMRRGRVVVSTVPLPHAYTGLDVYTRCTSPLRRYADMVVHWQIEAALRQEAWGDRFVATEGTSGHLPFSRVELDDSAILVRSREGSIALAQRGAEWFWQAQALFRAHHFDQAPLPKTFTMLVTTSHLKADSRASVLCEELNLNTLMEDTAKFGLPAVAAGDRWEAKLEEVLIFKGQLKFSPVRLISRHSE